MPDRFKLSNHFKHYLPLIGILAAGVIGFKVFYFDPVFRVVVVIGASLAYVVWGIIHHYIHDDLEVSVVLEYIALAIVGIVSVAVLF